MKNLKAISALTLAIVLTSTTLFAAPPKKVYNPICPLLTAESPDLQMKRRITNNENAFEIEVYQKLEKLREKQNETWLDEMLPPSLVDMVLVDSEQIVLHQNLDAILKQIPKRRLNFARDSQLKKELTEWLTVALENRVPKSTIPSRVEALMSLRVMEEGLEHRMEFLRYGLGEMTLEESQILLHGGNPLKPTKDSLLGKYISESGAKTLVRKFKKTPKGQNLGPDKLVVAVDERSFSIYKKYFTSPEYLVHVHTPSQGTLMMAHAGQTGTYASLRGGDIRRPSIGTLMPHIVLKTSEGQRVAQYYKLGGLANRYAKTPWEIPNYCAKGGYDSCTHWIGEMPIGDELDSYVVFPGNVDEHAGNAASKASVYSKVRRIKISEITEFTNTQNLDAIQLKEVNDNRARLLNLIQRVWRYPESHQQLAVLLGDKGALLRGEYANPGYVATRLIGNVTTDRVPVVFLVVGDAKKKIDPNFDPQISAY